MRIVVGVLAVKSNQLHIDSHGSVIMATELCNIRLLNGFFIGAQVSHLPLSGFGLYTGRVSQAFTPHPIYLQKMFQIKDVLFRNV